MKNSKKKAKELVRIFEIAVAMRAARLSPEFVVKSVRLALDYDGARELMLLWAQAPSAQDCEDVEADLQDEIDAHHSRSNLQRGKRKVVRFDDVELIAKDIEGFKRHLRRIVDQQGGISALAHKTGIPQPSLSRFFNSVSVPRRVTLYKIARALGLRDDEIITNWVA
ncbi:MAG: helix-turn-helix transcriptional regulator [Bdellovibrionales bacterium]|nr:helix-turn-helix transcriptional regulator [Bdellovibrionales bacterium]